MKSSRTIFQELIQAAGSTLFCLGFVFSVLSLLSGFLPGLSFLLLMAIGYGLVVMVNQTISIHSFLPLSEIRNWYLRIPQSRINYSSLLITVGKAVLGTLLGIAIILGCIFLLGQGYFHQRNTRQECQEIVTALNFYKDSQQAFPADLNALIGNDPLRRTWHKDDWGNPYEYTLTNNGLSFKLTSAGKDSKWGTTDDISFPNP